MPRQIAARAEDVGVSKARQDAPSTILLAVLAGAFIAMGAVFSTTAVTGCAGVLPFGLTRIIAGLAFSLGLILVVIAGAELFTGNNLLVLAFASRKISARALLRNWTLVYAGNLLGALATAAAMIPAGLHTFGAGQVGRTALLTADLKCSLSFSEALFRGVFCNALVCLAVWLCMSCRTTGDRILSCLFPVTAFVAAGFEHSVANMYYIPAALFIESSASPAFWEQTGLSSQDFPHLSWRNFILANLIPVTLGNILGGSVLVGAVYWIIYARQRPPTPGNPPSPPTTSQS